MIIYVVKSGDTLWQIAHRHGSELNQVILANQIADPSRLVIGQALVIPEPELEYVFQTGDSLARIASDYGVSVEALMQANNISDPGLVFAGDMLKIPSVTHTVRAGESLQALADRYHVTVARIAQANGLSAEAQLSVGQILHIPILARPVKEFNAYTTNVNEAGAQEALRLGRNFTYLSPFMHAVKEDGSFTPMQDQALLQAAGRTNTAPLFVITNFKNGNFDSDLAASILRNQSTQETLLTNILTEMRNKGYRGLNIDFEYVYPQDRENYNAFLRRVVARLHPEGFLVSTAVAPKERADQPGLLYEAHDYKAHGEIVDFVIPMTYEWGWAGGKPWAIAPINKMRDVLDYAVTAIPPEKIITGLPLYGRDWKIPWQEGSIARTISPEEAVNLAARYKEAISYNEEYQAPHFQYTDESGQRHEVWFEDARSMQAKYDLIKEYGLRGGSYWVLGNPFPQNWPVLENNFKVRKL